MDASQTTHYKLPNCTFWSDRLTASMDARAKSLSSNYLGKIQNFAAHRFLTLGLLFSATLGTGVNALIDTLNVGSYTLSQSWKGTKYLLSSPKNALTESAAALFNRKILYVHRHLIAAARFECLHFASTNRSLASFLHALLNLFWARVSMQAVASARSSASSSNPAPAPPSLTLPTPPKPPALSVMPTEITPSAAPSESDIPEAPIAPPAPATPRVVPLQIAKATSSSSAAPANASSADAGVPDAPPDVPAPPSPRPVSLQIAKATSSSSASSATPSQTTPLNNPPAPSAKPPQPKPPGHMMNELAGAIARRRAISDNVNGNVPNQPSATPTPTPSSAPTKKRETPNGIAPKQPESASKPTSAPVPIKEVGELMSGLQNNSNIQAAVTQAEKRKNNDLSCSTASLWLDPASPSSNSTATSSQSSNPVALPQTVFKPLDLTPAPMVPIPSDAAEAFKDKLKSLQKGYQSDEDFSDNDE